MDIPKDGVTEQAFAERYEAARAHLRREMDKRGLLESGGWRIAEKCRESARGSEVVLVPIHLQLPSPPDLECVVWIDELGETVDADCKPGGRPR